MSQESVQAALVTTIDSIKQNPASSSVVFRAETQWVEDVRCSATVRNFAPMTIDEPPELGGQDAAVNPVELVLVALGTCQEIMYAAYASVMGIKLDAVKVNVRGYLDLKGLLGMDDSIPAGYKRIKFETEIQSPASDEELTKLIEMVESHCPVLDILSTAQQVTGTARANGKQLVTLDKNAA
ncbi:MAG: OsmC family protein [Gammaproteobacteria bacterium]|nr:OsmC family protein [Gammaproteobacteria bacterium]